MEDLQSVLQSVLADPVQMEQIRSIAASLGLPPPGQGPGPNEGASAPQEASPEQTGAMPGPPALSGARGLEERVFLALRPGLSAAGQARVDRALRAARLSRMAGVILKQQGQANV